MNRHIAKILVSSCMFFRITKQIKHLWVMKHQFLCLKSIRNSRWPPSCLPNTKNDHWHIFINRNDFVNKGMFFCELTYKTCLLNIKCQINIHVQEAQGIQDGCHHNCEIWKISISLLLLHIKQWFWCLGVCLDNHCNHWNCNRPMILSDLSSWTYCFICYCCTLFYIIHNENHVKWAHLNKTVHLLDICSIKY